MSLDNWTQVAGDGDEFTPDSSRSRSGDYSLMVENPSFDNDGFLLLNQSDTDNPRQVSIHSHVQMEGDATVFEAGIFGKLTTSPEAIGLFFNQGRLELKKIEKFPTNWDGSSNVTTLDSESGDTIPDSLFADAWMEIRMSMWEDAGNIYGEFEYNDGSSWVTPVPNVGAAQQIDAGGGCGILAVDEEDEKKWWDDTEVFY